MWFHRHIFHKVIYRLYNSCLEYSCRIYLDKELSTGCCIRKWKSWNNMMNRGKFGLSMSDKDTDIWCRLGQLQSLRYYMWLDKDFHWDSKSYTMCNCQLFLHKSYSLQHMGWQLQNCWCIRSGPWLSIYLLIRQIPNHSSYTRFSFDNFCIQYLIYHIRDRSY